MLMDYIALSAISIRRPMYHATVSQKLQEHFLTQTAQNCFRVLLFLGPVLLFDPTGYNILIITVISQ